VRVAISGRWTASHVAVGAREGWGKRSAEIGRTPRSNLIEGRANDPTRQHETLPLAISGL
jgi:hypothetical protein